MEVIKKKINLEHGTSRKPDSTYGTITASTFSFKILLTQTYDNIGLYSDIDYDNDNDVDYTVLINKLNDNGHNFPFMSGTVPPSIILNGFTDCIRVDNSSVSDWFKYGDIIKSNTSTRLNELRSYNNNSQYVTGFNVNEETYTNYKNDTINGVSQVHKQNVNGETIYVFDTEDDNNLGTTGQTGGLLYTQKTDTSQSGVNTLKKPINTSVIFKSEGWNNTNTSLSAITKKEHLMGILYPPEVYSDIFINRGTTSAMEGHLKLSEVRGVEQLEKYGGGFYNVINK